MKKLLLMFTVIIGLMPSAEVNAASLRFAKQACKKELLNNPPQIEIKYNYGELKINHEKTAEQLVEMMDEMYPLKVTHKLNGLTSLSPYTIVESNIAGTGVSGYRCYYPQKVSVIIGYEPTVYISNDLKKDTCRYDVTMRHEQTHLDIGYLSLNKFLQTVKEEFPKIVDKVGVKVLPASSKITADEASTELNDKYRQRMGKLFDLFVKYMTNQQMKIDSVAGYEFESSLCKSDS